MDSDEKFDEDKATAEDLAQLEEQENLDKVEGEALVNYYYNLFRVGLMWVLTYFPFALIAFYAKYISGSIFTKYYLSGIASVISCFLGIILINGLGNRNALLVSSFLFLVAVVFLTLYETDVIQFSVDSPDSE